MKTLNRITFALLLPAWAVGRFYIWATKTGGLLGAVAILAYALPTISLFNILAPGISLLWPAFGIPAICIAITLLIEPSVSAVPGQPRNPSHPTASAR